jgi:c-di-GMP-binding flagellar brake protein YcgR
MASTSVPVAIPATFESMKLQIGTRLQMTQRAVGGERTSYTSLIGYVSNEYLMMRLPQENGLSVPLAEEEPLRFRIFTGLAVYTFSCVVETIFLAPRNYMVLSFPREIVGMNLRNSMRVRVELPVTINSNATAVISDLSTAGAQVTAEAALASVSEQISVSFAFRAKPSNSEIKLQTKAVVQSVRERRASREGEPSLVDHGLRFESLEGNDLVLLQNYVYEMLLENRGI